MQRKLQVIGAAMHDSETLVLARSAAGGRTKEEGSTVTHGLRVLIHAITGLVVGVCVVFVGVTVTLMLSFWNSTAVGIPGVIDVWTTEENGATALDFNPSFVGMGVAVLVIAAAYAVLLSLATRHRAARPGIWRRQP